MNGRPYGQAGRSRSLRDDPRARRSGQALASDQYLSPVGGLRVYDDGGIGINFDSAGPNYVGPQGVTTRVSGDAELVAHSPASIFVDAAKSVNGRFREAQSRQGLLAARASEMEATQAVIAGRATTLEGRATSVENRITALEATVAAQATTITDQATTIASHTASIASLTTDLATANSRLALVNGVLHLW